MLAGLISRWSSCFCSKCISPRSKVLCKRPPAFDLPGKLRFNLLQCCDQEYISILTCTSFAGRYISKIRGKYSLLIFLIASNSAAACFNTSSGLFTVSGQRNRVTQNRYRLQDRSSPLSHVQANDHLISLIKNTAFNRLIT